MWAIPRRSHWTALALEDAGFEIRDCIHHYFLSGFPKSLDVGKAIDKRLGNERKIVGYRKGQGNIPNDKGGKWGLKPNEPVAVTLPASVEAEQWEGWGTHLMPAIEHWWLVRKPLALNKQ